MRWILIFLEKGRVGFAGAMTRQNNFLNGNNEKSEENTLKKNLNDFDSYPMKS